MTVSPRDLQAVFFDIGGTLVGPNVRLLGSWLRAAGIDCADERLEAVEPWARRAHAIRRQAVLGTPAIRGLYVEELIRHVWGDQPGDPALLASAVDQTLATALAAGHAAVPVWNQVLPGVREGLATLRARGLRLVAVSNSDGLAEAVLIATGLRDAFEAVIDSHHVGFSKPDPRLFDAARAVLGVEARHVAHVGDLYEADVLGAEAAGIAAILIDSCGFWPDAACACVADFAGAVAVLTGDGERPRAGPSLRAE